MDEKQIKVVQMGVTTRCNGICRYCARHTKNIPIMDLDPKVIDKLPLETLDKIFISGLAGDPIFYNHLFLILENIQKRKPDMKFTICTNGSIHKPEWWENLAELMSGNSQNHIYFAVDGLEDTHKIHRGTDYNTVVRNIKAFVKAGGRSIWQTIAFKYNEHQIDECKKQAEESGSMFILKMSRQYEKEGQFSKPKIVKYKGRADMCKNINSEPYCFYTDKKEVWLEADGYLHPCCFMCARVFEISTKNIKIPWKLLLNYAKERQMTNLNTHSFQDSLNSSYFKYIEKNYKKIDICKTTCKIFWSDMIANLPENWEVPSKHESFNI